MPSWRKTAILQQQVQLQEQRQPRRQQTHTRETRTLGIIGGVSQLHEQSSLDGDTASEYQRRDNPSFGLCTLRIVEEAGQATYGSAMDWHCIAARKCMQ